MEKLDIVYTKDFRHEQAEFINAALYDLVKSNPSETNKLLLKLLTFKL